jgi:ribosome-associated protein
MRGNPDPIYFYGPGNVAWPFALNHKRRHPTILTDESYGPPDPEKIRILVEKSLDSDKADDVAVIPLDDNGALADYMIVASGTSSRHVAALAEKLRDRLVIRGVKDIRVEGLTQGDWVVLDAGDVIVHIFRPEVRAFYNIEKMWGDFARTCEVTAHA